MSESQKTFYLFADKEEEATKYLTRKHVDAQQTQVISFRNKPYRVWSVPRTLVDELDAEGQKKLNFRCVIFVRNNEGAARLWDPKQPTGLYRNRRVDTRTREILASHPQDA